MKFEIRSWINGGILFSCETYGLRGQPQSERGEIDGLFTPSSPATTGGPSVFLGGRAV